MRDPSEQESVDSVATRAARKGNRRAEAPGRKPAKGGRAKTRAVTRVNPEQASKVKMWMPTRLNNGEGRSEAGKEPTQAPALIHRGNGNGT